MIGPAVGDLPLSYISFIMLLGKLEEYSMLFLVFNHVEQNEATI